jgi:hypothetical protein
VSSIFLLALNDAVVVSGVKEEIARIGEVKIKEFYYTLIRVILTISLATYSNIQEESDLAAIPVYWHRRWLETKNYCNITHTSRLSLSSDAARTF